MVTASQLISYAAVSAVLIAVPGPSVLFAVGRTLSRGRRVAIASVIGNALGSYAVALLVSIGLGALVTKSDALLEILKLGGGAYLIALGVSAFRHRRSLGLAFTTGPDQASLIRAAREGFAVGLTNPKALILFVAILPQFVSRSAGHATGQMLILALVSVTTGLASDSTWVLAASVFRRWFARSPRRLELIGGAGGLAVVAVGISVALTGRKE